MVPQVRMSPLLHSQCRSPCDVLEGILGLVNLLCMCFLSLQLSATRCDATIVTFARFVAGVQGVIPKNATLTFQVELVKVR